MADDDLDIEAVAGKVEWLHDRLGEAADMLTDGARRIVHLGKAMSLIVGRMEALERRVVKLEGKDPETDPDLN